MASANTGSKYGTFQMDPNDVFFATTGSSSESDHDMTNQELISSVLELEIPQHTTATTDTDLAVSHADDNVNNRPPTTGIAPSRFPILSDEGMEQITDTAVVSGPKSSLKFALKGMRHRVFFVAALLVSADALYVGTAALNDQWLAYKATFGKEYIDGNEEIQRRLIWEENHDFIKTHNAEYEEGLHTYTVGLNQFADMTNEEFVAVMTGLLTKKRDATEEKYVDLEALPDSVDWKAKGWVGPVGNQGQCGSCWAFTATGAIEGQHAKKTGNLVPLSNQELMDCSTKEGNHGCEGGMMDDAFKYVKQNGGIDTDKSYPYEAKEEKCRFKKKNVGSRVTGFVDLKSGTEAELQEAVANIGPISSAVDATQRSFQLYKSGVYNEPKCDKKRVNHSLLVVGYGTQDGKEYWSAKNSWGTQWGMDGYILLARNKDNQCGIASMPSYPTV